MTCHIHGAINGLEYVLLDELALTQNADTSSVAVEQVAVLRELGEFHLCHIHERINFVLGPLEVFNAKGVDGDDFDTRFVADFKNLASSRISINQGLWRRSCHARREFKPTFANASKPRLWPSRVSIPWFRAKRRLPSMMKATCCGIGPCRNAPMRSSRSWRMPHSTGGDCRNHFRI